jgi:hypothetical protein
MSFMDILKKDIVKARKNPWGKILKVLSKNRKEIHTVSINSISNLEREFLKLKRELETTNTPIKHDIIFDGKFTGSSGQTEIYAVKRKSRKVKTQNENLEEVSEVQLLSTGQSDDLTTLNNLKTALENLKIKYNEEKYPKVHELLFSDDSPFTKIQKNLDSPLATKTEEIASQLKEILLRGNVNQNDEDEVKLINSLSSEINDFFKGRKRITAELRNLLVDEGASFSKVGGWLNQFKIYKNRTSREIMNDIFDTLDIDFDDDIKTNLSSAKLIGYLNMDYPSKIDNVKQIMDLYFRGGSPTISRDGEVVNDPDVDNSELKTEISKILNRQNSALYTTVALDIMEKIIMLENEITEMAKDLDGETQNTISQFDIALVKAKEYHEILHFIKIILETKGIVLTNSVVREYNQTRQDIDNLKPYMKDDVSLGSLFSNTFSIKGQEISVRDFKDYLTSIDIPESSSDSMQQGENNELLGNYEKELIKTKRETLLTNVTSIFTELEEKLTIKPKESVKDKDGKRKLVDRNVSQHFEGQSKNPNNPFLDQKTTTSRERSEDNMGVIERTRLNLLRDEREETERLWIDFALKFKLNTENETSLPKFDENDTSKINDSEILNYVLLKSNFLNKLVRQTSDLDKQKWAVLTLRNVNTVRRDLNKINNNITTLQKEVDVFFSKKIDKPKGNDITDTDESEYENPEYNDSKQLK